MTRFNLRLKWAFHLFVKRWQARIISELRWIHYCQRRDSSAGNKYALGFSVLMKTSHFSTPLLRMKDSSLTKKLQPLIRISCLIAVHLAQHRVLVISSLLVLSLLVLLIYFLLTIALILRSALLTSLLALYYNKVVEESVLDISSQMCRKRGKSQNGSLLKECQRRMQLMRNLQLLIQWRTTRMKNQWETTQREARNGPASSNDLIIYESKRLQQLVRIE